MTAERLPIHCLSTVCRTPHTPLCVAQHRCCARLGSLDLCWLLNGVPDPSIRRSTGIRRSRRTALYWVHTPVDRSHAIE